ncbi:MAG: hypothetical protein OHK0029_12080 [Armatimonadaceae bacterium]
MLSDFVSFEETLRFSPGHAGFVVFSEARRNHPMHRHAELEFNLVVRGTARYLLEDRRYDLRPGCLVWLFPAQDHVLVDRSPDYAQWIVVFRPELVQQCCRAGNYDILRSRSPVGYFCRTIARAESERLEWLLRETRDVPAPDSDRFNAGLGFLLLTAWNCFITATDTADSTGLLSPAVERAVRFVREHATEDHSASEIAHACGLSAGYLPRLFRQQTGMSLIEYRNRERVKRFLTESRAASRP